MRINLTKPRLIAAGVVLGLLILWLGYVFLWTTDKDRLKQVLKNLAAAAEAGDADRVMAEIADDFEAPDMARARLRILTANFFNLAGPTSVTYQDWGALQVSDNRALTDVIVFAATSMASAPYPVRGRSKWRIGFQKYGDRWMIRRIEPLEFDEQPVAGWTQVPDFSSWK